MFIAAFPLPSLRILWPRPLFTLLAERHLVDRERNVKT